MKSSTCQVLVVDGFVPRQTCEEIVRSAGKKRPFDLEVGGGIVDGGKVEAKSLVDKTVRNAQSCPLGSLDPLVNSIMQQIVSELVEPVFGLTVDYWELPQILIYLPGGHYSSHIDGEIVGVNRQRRVLEWQRTADRDVSVVWYLNEEFRGGELEFPRFGLTIRPKTGMVVVFPSTHMYVHAAQPVIDGTRYAIVSWIAAVGTPRVFPTPPPHVLNHASGLTAAD